MTGKARRTKPSPEPKRAAPPAGFGYDRGLIFRAFADTVGVAPPDGAGEGLEGPAARSGNTGRRLSIRDARRALARRRPRR